jgi:hypothetical protein
MTLIVNLTIHGKQPVGDIHNLELDTAKLLHDKLVEQYKK